MIGTLYYKRARLLKNLKEIASLKGYRVLDYLYSDKTVFYLHKYIMHDKRYADIEKEDVHFTSLSLERVREVYKDSKVLVDYSADDQTGLSMRTIESLGYGCKLVTNNKIIVETDFYNPGNIYIYDIDNFSIPDGFVKTPYVPLEDSMYRYYSLEGWVDTVFGE